MTAPVYAIGDIHGQLAQLEGALARIEKDGGADARIVFLGDYIDRGAHSREVIDLLLAGLAEGRDWICLLGNHDRMLAMFMENYPRNDARFPVGYHWLHDQIGGIEALKSYGVEVAEDEPIYRVHDRARAAVPQEHIQFLCERPYYHIEGELLFTHAGIKPGVPFEKQDRDDLIWIRDEFLNDTREHPWLVIHGHTPVKKAGHRGNRVNLDTGAGQGRALTAAAFVGRACYELTDAGRVRLEPEVFATPSIDRNVV
ncbi:metallophosphoesterase family protein [Ruegeria lacuscaerulensis]|uniref:metallophosphoesterase family protein n=1 Tax=Ruegeria lacuscaerulensis TaxID=55218 RepID=UPI001479E950|nr:metallophosphoesterase family protein [Ruegeria lacuscaerulensis]